MSCRFIILFFLMTFGIFEKGLCGYKEQIFYPNEAYVFIPNDFPNIDKLLEWQERLKTETTIDGHFIFTNGSSSPVRVTWIEQDPMGGGYNVMYLPSKGRLQSSGIDNSSDGASFTIIPNTATGEPVEQEGYEFGNGSGDALIGALGSAGFAALFNSIYGPQIEQVYEKMAKFQELNRDSFEEIQQIQIKVKGSVIQLGVTLKSFDTDFNLPDLGAGKFKVVPNILGSNTYASQLGVKGYQWLSQNTEFKVSAEQIRAQLINSEIDTDIDQIYFNIASLSLIEADEWSAIGADDESDALLKTSQAAADVLVGWDPYTGIARSLYEFTTGVNPFTGKNLTSFERFASGLGLLSFGVAGKLPLIFKVLKPLAAKLGSATSATMMGVSGIINKAGQGALQTNRTINFLSKQNPKWGLTMTHTLKHFNLIDDSPFSMTRIDPKGNINIWVNHVMEISQLPPTRTWTERGQRFLEIRAKVPKTGSDEMMNLGVRLAEQADGSFDLVTILTKNP